MESPEASNGVFEDNPVLSVPYGLVSELMKIKDALLITGAVLIGVIIAALLLLVVFGGSDKSDKAVSAPDNQESAKPDVDEDGNQPVGGEESGQDETVPDALSGGPTKVMYVVVPHPDDEFQAWPLIENTPDTHKVFLMLTRGEQPYYCDSPAYDDQYGARPPDPWPDGRWSLSCEQARINSFFGFMKDMGAVDAGLAESYDELGVRGPFDGGDQIICRRDSLDNSQGECITDSTARVWTSLQATVIWFNLGDGDLTAQEARWAISTVLANKPVFGIDSQLADTGIVGASYYDGTEPSSCSGYMHPDHGAIQTALKESDFGAGWQAAAICNADPEATMEASVTDDSYSRAFGKPPDSPLGAFFVNYGWLSSATEHGHPDDHHGQDANFHRNQTFWIRQ